MATTRVQVVLRGKQGVGKTTLANALTRCYAFPYFQNCATPPTVVLLNAAAVVSRKTNPDDTPQWVPVGQYLVPCLTVVSGKSTAIFSLSEGDQSCSEAMNDGASSGQTVWIDAVNFMEMRCHAERHADCFVLHPNVAPLTVKDISVDIAEARNSPSAMQAEALRNQCKVLVVGLDEPAQGESVDFVIVNLRGPAPVDLEAARRAVAARHSMPLERVFLVNAQKALASALISSPLPAALLQAEATKLTDALARAACAFHSNEAASCEFDMVSEFPMRLPQSEAAQPHMTVSGELHKAEGPHSPTPKHRVLPQEAVRVTSLIPERGYVPKIFQAEHEAEARRLCEAVNSEEFGSHPATLDTEVFRRAASNYSQRADVVAVPSYVPRILTQEYQMELPGQAEPYVPKALRNTETVSSEQVRYRVVQQ